MAQEATCAASPCAFAPFRPAAERAVLRWRHGGMVTWWLSCSNCRMFPRWLATAAARFAHPCHHFRSIGLGQQLQQEYRTRRFCIGGGPHATVSNNALNSCTEKSVPWPRRRRGGHALRPFLSRTRPHACPPPLPPAPALLAWRHAVPGRASPHPRRATAPAAASGLPLAPALSRDGPRGSATRVAPRLKKPPESYRPRAVQDPRDRDPPCDTK